MPAEMPADPPGARETFRVVQGNEMAVGRDCREAQCQLVSLKLLLGIIDAVGVETSIQV